MAKILVSIVMIAALFPGFACGTVADGNDARSETIDALQNDGGGSADAPGPDALAHGIVTVRVFLNGAPAQNIAVFSHEPDGSYINSKLTDAAGEVVFDNMPVGGAVTAPVNPFDTSSRFLGGIGQTWLTTVTDVDIGDVIIFGKSVQFAGAGPSAGTLTVTMPGAVSSATNYRALTGCSNSSTSIVGAVLTPTLREGCLPPGNVAHVVGYAEAAGNRIAYTTQTDVALSGTSPALAGSTTMPAWQTDLGSYQVSLTNAPQDGDINAQFRGFKQNISHDQFNPDTAAVVTGGGGSFTTKVAPGFFDETMFAISVLFTNGTDETTSLVAVRNDNVPSQGSPVTLGIDLTSDTGQLITNVVALDDDPIAVTWNATSLACKDNPTPDGLVWIVFAQTGLPAVGAFNPSFFWIVLSPGSSQSGVALPRLDPAVAQTLWPSSTFTATQAGLIFKSDSSMTYADMRNSENNLSFFNYMPETTATRCLTTGGAL